MGFFCHDSMRWLRLLHQCLIQSPPLAVAIATTASGMPSLLTTCTSLLLSPHCQEHAGSIEAVLLKLGLCSTEVGLSLFDVVLRKIYGGIEGGQSEFQTLGEQRKHVPEHFMSVDV